MTPDTFKLYVLKCIKLWENNFENTPNPSQKVMEVTGSAPGIKKPQHVILESLQKLKFDDAYQKSTVKFKINLFSKNYFSYFFVQCYLIHYKIFYSYWSKKDLIMSTRLKLVLRSWARLWRVVRSATICMLPTHYL